MPGPSINYSTIGNYADAAGSSCVSYAGVAVAGRAVPHPPDFLFGSVPDYIFNAMFGELDFAAAGLWSIREGQVIGLGVPVHRTTVLSYPEANLWSEHQASALAAHGVGDLGPPDAKLDGRYVFLAGPGHHVYGHWLVDLLPRLHILQQLGFSLDELGFVLAAGTPPFALAMLRSLGIHPSHVYSCSGASELIEVEELLLPSNLRHGSRLAPVFTAAVASLLMRVTLVDAPSGDWTRVFVSRRQADHARNLVNRAEAEELAASFGYRTLDPASISFPEQVALFRRCRALAGEYGSGLHNSIWMPDRATVCAIRSTSNYPGFIQTSLAERRGQRIGYVFCPAGMNDEQQSFAVNLDLLRKGLECTEVHLATIERVHGGS